MTFLWSWCRGQSKGDLILLTIRLFVPKCVPKFGNPSSSCWVCFSPKPKMVDGSTFATFEPQANVTKTKVTKVGLITHNLWRLLSDCLNLTCVCQLFSVLYSCLVMWSADVFFWPMLSWFSSVLLDTDIKLIYMQFGFTQFPIFCLQCRECHTFICEPWASTSDQLWDLRCLTIAFLVWRNLVNYMKVQKSRKPYK